MEKTLKTKYCEMEYTYWGGEYVKSIRSGKFDRNRLYHGTAIIGDVAMIQQLDTTGRAHLILADDGKTRRFYLQSYNTIVCAFNDSTGFTKLWDGYSATTQKHINAFREKFGLDRINKAQWLALA